MNRTRFHLARLFKGTLAMAMVTSTLLWQPGTLHAQEQTQQLYMPVVAPQTVASQAAVAPAAQTSQTLYGVTTGNRLIQFNSADPCTILMDKPLTGLRPTERLRGIDFRPLNGQLYGIGSSSRLYTINPQSAVATPLTMKPLTMTLDSKGIGFDFNPAVDRIRVVGASGQNLRLHPDTGTIAGVDGRLTYTATDTFAGRAPRIVASAYTNPDNDPATGTTLYNLDATFNALSIQNPPNVGLLTTVGSLQFDLDRVAGFDIAPSNIAYAALRESSQMQAAAGQDTWAMEEQSADAAESQAALQPGACGLSQLVTIDLTTGRATSLGFIGVAASVEALASPTQ